MCFKEHKIKPEQLIGAYVISGVLFILYGIIFYYISINSEKKYIGMFSLNVFLYVLGIILFFIYFYLMLCFLRGGRNLSCIKGNIMECAVNPWFTDSDTCCSLCQGKQGVCFFNSAFVKT